MSTIKVTNVQDTSGGNSSTSAEIFSGRAKAWINFDGTGTVSISDSFNVSSVTDNGTGDYTVSFTNAMANANYAFTYGMEYVITTRESVIQVQKDSITTSGLRILTGYSYTSPGPSDPPAVSIVIHSD
jgi:hypothetical protein